MNDRYAYRDRDHPTNSPQYRTGKLCVEGCGRPAGTHWSPIWCVECNIERMDRLNARFQEIEAWLRTHGMMEGES